MTVSTLITAAAGFESARQLAALGADRSHGRLHGHSFRVAVRAALPSGWAPFDGGEVAALQAALIKCTAQLDRGSLNERIHTPGDEQIARWIHAQLGLPGTALVGLRSDPMAGVELDVDGQAHHWRRFAFQSAHRLPHVPPGHKCGRMHGHGFDALVHARASQEEIDAAWAPLQAQLDHACLNDLPGLENPTSEMLSSWLWARLQAQLPGLSNVTVYETAACGASYDGAAYRIWKEFTLDSALMLRRAPTGHAARRLHGHTYTLRLHLCGPLDALLGWAVDFGDVKYLFDPIFQALDHQPLHEITGLVDCDTASLAAWILDNAHGRLPQLDRVDLFETPGCGALVSTAAPRLVLTV